MILSEDDLIRKNIKNDEFDKKLSELREKYLSQIYSNYMFFSLENKETRERLVYSTNLDWQSNYIDHKMIDNCPLYAATVLSPRNYRLDRSFFLWNQIIPEGKMQRDVIGVRAEHGIANGLSITKKIGNYQAMLGLASDPKDHELERNYTLVLPKIITLFAAASSLCFSKQGSISETILIRTVSNDFKNNF